MLRCVRLALTVVFSVGVAMSLLFAQAKAAQPKKTIKASELLKQLHSGQREIMKRLGTLEAAVAENSKKIGMISQGGAVQGKPKEAIAPEKTATPAQPKTMEPQKPLDLEEEGLTYHQPQQSQQYNNRGYYRRHYAQYSNSQHPSQNRTGNQAFQKEDHQRAVSQYNQRYGQLRQYAHVPVPTVPTDQRQYAQRRYY